MILNYLKFAWRNLKHNKLYSIINIIGLAFGMASFLIIVLYTQYQYSYDQFHEKKDRIYRVNRYLDGGTGGPIKMRNSQVSPYTADLIRDNVSMVEAVTRFSGIGG
jgi:putative ABC transport system permease protein